MRFRTGLITAVCLVAACSGSGPGDDGSATTTTGSPPLAQQPAYELGKIQLVSAVQRTDSCNDLLARLRRLGDEHVGPYGFGWGYGVMPLAEGAARGDVAAASDMSAGGPQAATAAPQEKSFSGTNNQEAGVDEADMVKSDGERLYVLRDNRLVIVDVSAGGPGGKVLGSVSFEEASPMSMLLGDGVVMVLSQRYFDPADMKGDGSADPLRALGVSRTQVSMVDVSDPTSPKVTDDVEIDGDLAAARLVGGRAHLVLRSTPLGLPFVMPQSRIGEDVATEMNRRIVAEAPLEQWLPHMWRDGKRADLVDCDSVWIPQTFAGVQMTSIVSMPLGDRVDPSTASLLAPGDVVYASPQSVYVTAQAWFDQRKVAEDEDSWPKPSDWKTAVHRFSIGDAAPGYLASGVVPGVVRNSFSLGEVDDHLVIATTTGLPWSVDEDEQSTSRLASLATDGSKLVEVGVVDGLGKGETIHSVRIIAKRAYVVTFRQTDPFFVVDLTDAAAPKLAGELKILGYSGYLHPVSDDLILGIGRDADAEGRDTGMAATLFDVSNPAAPTAVGRWSQPGAHSEVEWDHHAFTYWEPSSTAFVPTMNYDATFAGYGRLVALSTEGRTLNERGRIGITQMEAGITNCTKFTAEQIAELLDPTKGALPQGGFVQLCGPGQSGATAMTCSELDDSMVKFYTGKTREELGIAPDRTIESCYPDTQHRIERSVIVGDTLWMLSEDLLQANDLATLTPGRQVSLSS
ncbi:MAG: beta-propeller domain-containing protein [Microthrixaceae bacterium]|nr:beta-propeller domain-containing protein [Microthrixaceae bacterium]